MEQERGLALAIATCRDLPLWKEMEMAKLAVFLA
jgi:hypothetical protein